jgi:transcription elongation factor Elf1
MPSLPSYEFFTQHPELAREINLVKAINSAQEPLWNDPTRGLTLNTRGEENLRSMQEQSLNRGKPISFQLDDSSFNLELLRKSLTPLVYVVHEQQLDQTMDSKGLVKKMDGQLGDIVVNSLRVNEGYFTSLGEEWGVSPLMLSIIGEALIQPSMIHLASVCQRSYLDGWGDVICPVCGRRPSTAVKAEVWRFKCHLCRAEYRVDIFSCPHCKSRNHEEKEFLLVGESQEFEVATCSRCNHYYKVINRSKLKETIPEGFEDLYTFFLDEIASERGLKRLDEKTSGVE